MNISTFSQNQHQNKTDLPLLNCPFPLRDAPRLLPVSSSLPLQWRLPRLPDRRQLLRKASVKERGERKKETTRTRELKMLKRLEKEHVAVLFINMFFSFPLSL